MKKHLIILCFMGLFTISLQAQEPACMPDTTIIDSAGAIFPRPFLPDDTLNIGIQKVACINEPFEFVFTVVIPKMATLSGIPITLRGGRMDTVGAIGSLPDGLNYHCFPADCVFDTLVPSCIVLTGTPTTMNDTGVYDLSISFELDIGLGYTPITFPGTLFPGNYFLKLQEEGSENCGEILAVEKNETIRGVYNAPNPFTQHTTIYLHTGEPTNMNLDIMDMTGRTILTSRVSLNQGLNLIPVDLGFVPPGIYAYMLSNHREKVVHKMVVYDR